MMRLFSAYCHRIAGAGCYYLALASLLAVSICGSAFFLFQLGDSTKIPSSSAKLVEADALLPQIVKRQVEVKDKNAWLVRLEAAISDQLCNDPSLTCRFEQRHMPPMVPAISTRVVAKMRHLRQSVVLVVTFNRRSTYFVAPLVHTLYSQVFADIVYCGPSQNETAFRRGIARFFDDPDLLDYFGRRYLGYQSPEPHIDGYGENNYFCFNLALQRIAQSRPHLQVDGVLVLADDALFSYWNIAFRPQMFNTSRSHSLPFPKVIYDTETLKSCDISVLPSTCDRPNPWHNWPQNYRKPTSAFYHELVQMARAETGGKTFAKCLKRVSTRARGIYRVLTGYSDLFYVARRDFGHAVAMFEMASRNHVFQEIAVPTTFACFEASSFIDDSGDDTNSVSENRTPPWEAFDAGRLLTHPFKLSSMVRAMSGDSEARNSHVRGICLYCMLAQYSKYLSLLVSTAPLV